MKSSRKWDKFIENISAFKFNSDFEKTDRLIHIYIPYIYTDCFINFRNNILNEVKTLPKIIFTANGYQSNEEFKLMAAEIYSNNGKILMGQHGGNMGLAKHNQAEEHQIKIANHFYSFGWSINNKKNIISMRSMKLSTFGRLKPKKKVDY